MRYLTVVFLLLICLTGCNIRLTGKEVKEKIKYCQDYGFDYMLAYNNPLQKYIFEVYCIDSNGGTMRSEP